MTTTTPDLDQLIACPTCHAKVTQTCRTRRGRRTGNHSSRLTARLCPCGNWPEPTSTYCAGCALEHRRATNRDHYARTRSTAA